MSTIKVYLRIKPHLGGDREIKELPMEIRENSNRKKLYFQYRLKKEGTKIFTFDDIFAENSSQEEVYNVFKGDLINSVLNGVVRPNLVQLLPDGLRSDLLGKVLHYSRRRG